MKEWAKSILVRYYIGAIVIAMLLTDVVRDVMRLFIEPATVVLLNAQSRTFERGPLMIASRVVPNLASAVLSLGAAYLLATWLYGDPPRQINSDVTQSHDTESPAP